MHLPESFLCSLQNIDGFSREAFVREHSVPEKITSVRINPFKWQQNSLPFTAHPLPLSRPVPWCATGQYLPERPLFITDPLFHAGCYYVQEASSMFLEEIIRSVFPDHSTTSYKVLDLCAAPGGKTTHLSSLFPDSIVVANEVIKTRVPVLSENAVKWGMENILVSSNDAADFKALPGYFDLIVTDAPCSGSGMFRKDPEAISEWSLQHVALCSQRQRRIIQDSWTALKENGILVYCTCSFSKEENEDILDWIAETFAVESIPARRSVEWGIVETQSDKSRMYGYRFYPDKIKGEGFFIACMRKKEPADARVLKPQGFLHLSKKEESVVASYIKQPERYSVVRVKEEMRIIEKNYKDELAVLYAALYVKKMGVNAGRIIKNELVPDHELALSTIISPDRGAIEADLETALEFLRKKDIPSGNAAKGWNVVRFMGHNLGWVKVLPNRVNNYYPSASRILKY